MIKKFNRMSKPKRIIIIFGIIIAVLYGIIIIGSIGTTITYSTYDTQTSANIYDVESHDTYVKCIKMTNYKAKYAYDYAGKTYTAQTGWIDTKLSYGDKIAVRFNKDNPAKSTLEAERDSSVSFAIAGSIVAGFAVIWYFMNRTKGPGRTKYRRYRS